MLYVVILYITSCAYTLLDAGPKLDTTSSIPPLSITASPSSSQLLQRRITRETSQDNLLRATPSSPPMPALAPATLPEHSLLVNAHSQRPSSYSSTTSNPDDNDERGYHQNSTDAYPVVCRQDSTYAYSVHSTLTKDDEKIVEALLGDGSTEYTAELGTSIADEIHHARSMPTQRRRNFLTPEHKQMNRSSPDNRTKEKERAMERAEHLQHLFGSREDLLAYERDSPRMGRKEQFQMLVTSLARTRAHTKKELLDLMHQQKQDAEKLQQEQRRATEQLMHKQDETAQKLLQQQTENFNKMEKEANRRHRRNTQRSVLLTTVTAGFTLAMFLINYMSGRHNPHCQMPPPQGAHNNSYSFS